MIFWSSGSSPDPAVASLTRSSVVNAAPRAGARTSAPRAAPPGGDGGPAGRGGKSFGMTGVSVFFLSLRGDPLDEHRAEPVAPPGQVLRGQVQARHGGLGARDGHTAQFVPEQAADRFHVFRIDRDAEELFEVGDREAGGDPGGAGG